MLWDIFVGGKMVESVGRHQVETARALDETLQDVQVHVVHEARIFRYASTITHAWTSSEAFEACYRYSLPCLQSSIKWPGPDGEPLRVFR